MHERDASIMRRGSAHDAIRTNGTIVLWLDISNHWYKNAHKVVINTVYNMLMFSPCLPNCLQL